MEALDDTTHSSTRYYQRCYSIDPAHLRRIVTMIADRAKGSVDISVSLDGTESISGGSLDNVLQSTVLDAHDVDEIRLDARHITSNGITSLSVLYRKIGMAGSIRLAISGRSDAVIAAREDLDRVIRTTARWYWPINYKGSVAVFLVAFLLAGAAAMLLAAYCLIFLISEATRKEYPNVIGGLFAFLTFSFMVTAWNVRDYFFPSLEFRFGKSAIKADWRDRVRKLLFASIIGTTLLTFAGNKVWEAIQAKTSQAH